MKETGNRHLKTPDWYRTIWLWFCDRDSYIMEGIPGGIDSGDVDEDGNPNVIDLTMDYYDENLGQARRRTSTDEDLQSMASHTTYASNLNEEEEEEGLVDKFDEITDSQSTPLSQCTPLSTRCSRRLTQKSQKSPEKSTISSETVSSLTYLGTDPAPSKITKGRKPAAKKHVVPLLNNNATASKNGGRSTKASKKNAQKDGTSCNGATNDVKPPASFVRQVSGAPLITSTGLTENGSRKRPAKNNPAGNS
jgi:hypothetical protein